MSSIELIHARQILDSRGNPTLEVEVVTAEGAFGRAAAHGKTQVLRSVHNLPRGIGIGRVGERDGYRGGRFDVQRRKVELFRQDVELRVAQMGLEGQLLHFLVGECHRDFAKQ